MKRGKKLNKLFLVLSHLPMPGHKIRPFFVKLGGVKILDWKSTFIGEDVVFDTVHPDLITLEPGVRVTARSAILTHYLNPSTGHNVFGEVRIKKGAFIGIGTLIVKPVTIGEGAIVGAGSVVTRDVPDGCVFAGNPAKQIIRKTVSVE